MLKDSHPRSSRGVSGDDPEGGAGSGVLRRRLVTARPGRQGKPLARQYDLAARISLDRSDACRKAGSGERSAAPMPKTATVERREASVPRHGTQGASQAPDVPRHGMSNGCASAAPERLSALRPPLDGVSEAKRKKTWAQTCVAGTRKCPPSGLWRTWWLARRSFSEGGWAV